MIKTCLNFRLSWSKENKMHNCDADEKNDCVAENDNMLSPDDYDCDLASIQTLQMNRDSVESDITALEEEVSLSGTCFLKLTNSLILKHTPLLYMDAQLSYNPFPFSVVQTCQ